MKTKTFNKKYIKNLFSELKLNWNKMEQNFEFLVSLWKNYSNASNMLTKAMGGTSNEVGDFAERLVCAHYNGELLPSSNKSADIRTGNGKLIQVKSRKIVKLAPTSLNVIRSWDFDILVVVIFGKDGNVLKAIEIDTAAAKSLAKRNNHQNGDILNTSNLLLRHSNAIDITEKLQDIIDNKYIFLEKNKSHIYKSNSPTRQKYNNLRINGSNLTRTPIIELIPPDADDFKDQLLKTKTAKRIFYFENGEKQEFLWNANKLTRSSDIYANIKTNNNFRNWKKLGIIKVLLEVID